RPIRQLGRSQAARSVHAPTSQSPGGGREAMTGTITKRARKGGKPSWGYVFDAGRDYTGKRLQETRSGFATKKEASDALRDAIAVFEVKRDAAPVMAKPTFSAFFDTWMKEHASRNCAPKPLERYVELADYAIRQTIEVDSVEHKLGDVALDRFTAMALTMVVNA